MYGTEPSASVSPFPLPMGKVMVQNNNLSIGSVLFSLTPFSLSRFAAAFSFA
ncbi:MAG: hypothetical protein ACRDDZ_09610 [Marinifilaceae bacterium]